MSYMSMEYIDKLQKQIEKLADENKQLKKRIVECEMSIKNVQDYSEKLYNDNRELQKQAGEAEGARDELRGSLKHVRKEYRDLLDRT